MNLYESAHGRVKQFFDEKAESYVRTRSTDSNFAEIVAQVLAWSDAPEQGQVLDIGCGCGTVSEILAQRGHVVHGLDISSEMIARAEERRRQLEPAVGERMSYSCGALEDMAPSAVYQQAVCLGVLEYVADPNAFLKTICNALKPGGRLILQIPNRNSWVQRKMSLAFKVNCWLGRAQPLPVERRLRTRRELERLLHSAGFEVAAIRHALHQGWNGSFAADLTAGCLIALAVRPK